MMLNDEQIEQIRNIYLEMFQENYRAGVPKIPPHSHDGIDNIPVDAVLSLTAGTGITITPTGSIRGNLVISVVPTPATPGGVNGDLQINASGVFGTIAGLNLDQTGNARGTSSLDIQSKRTAVTQVASGATSVALGIKNTAATTNSVAIGVNNNTIALGTDQVSIGVDNLTEQDKAVAVGVGNISANNNDVCIGNNNSVNSGFSIAAGNNNTVTGGFSNVFGYGSSATGTNSVTIGNSLGNSTTDALQIGMHSTLSLQITKTGNYGFNGVSYGGGVKVLFIANASTTPTSTPVGGGVLYVTGGALTYIGSSGTVTTIALA